MLGRAGKFSRYQFLGLLERNTEVNPATALVIALTLLPESDPLLLFKLASTPENWLSPGATPKEFRHIVRATLQEGRFSRSEVLRKVSLNTIFYRPLTIRVVLLSS